MSKSLGLTPDGYRLRANAAGRAWHAAHREQSRSMHKRWREANPGVNSALTKVWQIAHPGYAGQYYLKRLELAAGSKRPKRCCVCKKYVVKICFDHCHKYNEFRGWLCDNCNKALGQVNDSSKLLRKLADYVDAHNAKRKAEKNAPKV